MSKVISTKSISFPAIGWAISEGVPTELPADKDMVERIMQEPEITMYEEKIKNNQSNKDNK